MLDGKACLGFCIGGLYGHDLLQVPRVKKWWRRFLCLFVVRWEDGMVYLSSWLGERVCEASVGEYERIVP